MATKYTERDVRIIRLLKRHNASTREISEAMEIPESSVDSLKLYGLNPPRKPRPRAHRRATYDPPFEEQMKTADRIMKKRHPVLRELAK